MPTIPALREAVSPEHPKPAATLRSVSLEFTPDGASDVRVRLSERAGEVHVSLHSSDPSLAGRVREGVSDLVGSLSNAGYDAEASRPVAGAQQHLRQEANSQQRQQQHQGDDSARRRPGGDDDELFGDLFQPIQEVL